VGGGEAPPHLFFFGSCWGRKSSGKKKGSWCGRFLDYFVSGGWNRGGFFLGWGSPFRRLLKKTRRGKKLGRARFGKKKIGKGWGRSFGPKDSPVFDTFPFRGSFSGRLQKKIIRGGARPPTLGQPPKGSPPNRKLRAEGRLLGPRPFWGGGEPIRGRWPPTFFRGGPKKASTFRERDFPGGQRF